MINRTSRIIALIVLMLWFLVLSFQRTTAQNVVRQGKVFVQQVSSKDSTNTGYTYQDKDSNKHTVYLSSKGNAYIYVRSKKTGKYYRRYLPKITKMLNEMNHGRRFD